MPCRHSNLSRRVYGKSRHLDSRRPRGRVTRHHCLTLQTVGRKTTDSLLSHCFIPGRSLVGLMCSLTKRRPPFRGKSSFRSGLRLRQICSLSLNRTLPKICPMNLRLNVPVHSRDPVLTTSVKIGWRESPCIRMKGYFTRFRILETSPYQLEVHRLPVVICYWPIFAAPQP